MTSLSVSTLKRRRDFLAAAKGSRCSMSAVVVQWRKRKPEEVSPTSIRIGFTATKALGNAVVRARVKRRLRAAAAQLVPAFGMADSDYVFIGRDAAYRGTFDGLIKDMKHALKRLADQASGTRNQKPE